MYKLIRPLLFTRDAESAHNQAMRLLRRVSQSPSASNILHTFYAGKIRPHPLELMGLPLAHPLGLAAGLDKQGVAGDALSALGFSFIEYGTVTPLPQQGNPKPRLFRLAEHNAIINRMGFNSIGLQAFLDNLNKSHRGHIKGLNIGKNAHTAIEDALDDYNAGLESVYPVADYICINISSPNTKNLRELQSEAHLDALLAGLSRTRRKLEDKHACFKPMALKVAPDVDSGQIDTICRLLRRHNIDGLVAGNTTISRQAISNHPLASQSGGLSGRPLRKQATWCVEQFARRLQGEIPIIGVGGIDDISSAREKLDAGATAIQLYTGLIYQGPGVVKRIVNAL
jgi:dihydroorotate dehydrogenase